MFVEELWKGTAVELSAPIGHKLLWDTRLWQDDSESRRCSTGDLRRQSNSVKLPRPYILNRQYVFLPALRGHCRHIDEVSSPSCVFCVVIQLYHHSVV